MSTRTENKLWALILLAGVCIVTFALVGCSVSFTESRIFNGAKKAYDGAKELPMEAPGYAVENNVEQGSDAKSDGRAAIDATVNSPNATTGADTSGDNTDAPPPD